MPRLLLPVCRAIKILSQDFRSLPLSFWHREIIVVRADVVTAHM